MKKIKIAIAGIMFLLMGLIAAACGFYLEELPPDLDIFGGLNWTEILARVDWTDVLTREIIQEIIDQLDIEDFFTRDELIEFLGDGLINEDDIKNIIRDFFANDQERLIISRLLFDDIISNGGMVGVLAAAVLMHIVNNETMMEMLMGSIINNLDAILEHINILDLIPNLLTPEDIELLLRDIDLLDFIDLEEALKYIDILAVIGDTALINMFVRLLGEEAVMALIVEGILDEENFLDDLLELIIDSNEFRLVVIQIIRNILDGYDEWYEIRNEIREYYLAQEWVQTLLNNPAIPFTMAEVEVLVQIELERRIREGLV